MAELFNEIEDVHDTVDEIGNKIRGIRKEKGITLKQLSERTGLSIGYLSNLERDSSSPTLDRHAEDMRGAGSFSNRTAGR